VRLRRSSNSIKGHRRQRYADVAVVSNRFAVQRRVLVPSSIRAFSVPQSSI
jgi:hypothetical protein